MKGVESTLVLGFITFTCALAGCTAPDDLGDSEEGAEAAGATEEEVGVVQNPLSSAEAKVDWEFRRASGANATVSSGIYFGLRNRVRPSERFLGQETSPGVDLAFSSGIQEDFILTPASGPGPVRYGERVSIFVRSEGYLAYGLQIQGIWLHFENKPADEWKVFGGEAGTPVQTNLPVGLYNTHHGDYLVYCDRSGSLADLRWAADCDRSPPPPPPPPDDSVDTTVRLKLMDPVAGVQSCPFPGSATYTFTPVALTGQSGQSSAFTVNHSWPNALGTCVISQPVFNVRAGEWHVTAQSGSFVTSCDVDLPGPPLQDFINFEMLHAGCTQGVSFPGD